MTTVISVENLSKTYRLGQIGTGTFTNDLKMWWAKARGNPNPLLRIGETDHENRNGEDIWALHDVSFTVEQGEVLGIIGRNGAGKSTLLKILSRVTAPTSGQIKVKGRVVSLLEVGTGFHPELTGRENIYLNGAILGMSRREIDRKFDEIVNFAEVEKFIDTPVKRYSSGMYVRLAFAVAAHLEPEILVVDEVLAVGDADFQKKCLGKMGEVALGGRTVLFVSHNMASIQNLCPKSILLRSGKLISLDNTNIVIDRYLNETSFFDNSKDLNERGGREGNGAMRFLKIQLLDQYGNQISSAQTGKNVALALFYEMIGETSKPAIIRILITNNAGLKMFMCLSRNSYPNVMRLSKKGTIICHFPKLSLLPGEYHISVWCKIDEKIADNIENAYTLEVTEGDYFGTGKLNLDNDTRNGMLSEHYWELTS